MQSPVQCKGIQDTISKLEGPIRLAKLAALSAIYRDIHLVAASMHRRVAHGAANPLTDEADDGVSSSSRSKGGPSPAVSFPLNDVTNLPDLNVPSGLNLDPKCV